MEMKATGYRRLRPQSECEGSCARSRRAEPEELPFLRSCRRTLGLGDAFKKYNIRSSLIAGGHGTTAEQAEIGAALGEEVSSR